MRRLSFVAATVATLIVCAPAAAEDSKTYTLTVAPDQVEQSSTVEMSATITVVGKSTQKAGSANIVVPSEFSNLELVSGPGAPATTTLAGHTIELRNLALRPGDSATAVVRATAPSEVGQYFWNARVKQSQTFSESSNDWTMIGAATDRDTNVYAPSPPPPPPPSCEDDTGCTARHGVPQEWVQGFNSSAGAGDYYVDTTVVTHTPTAGELVKVGYLNAGDAVNRDTACDGVVRYIEPSDAAVLFSGPGRKTVTFSLSPDLAGAISGFQTPESCFSAPDPFTAKALDAPFLFGSQVWENGLLADCDPESLLKTACVDRGAAGSWVTIQIPGGGIYSDPANR